MTGEVVTCLDSNQLSFFLFYFEIISHIAQTGLRLTVQLELFIFLTLLPKSWDYKSVLPYLALAQHHFMAWEKIVICNDGKSRLLKSTICIMCKRKYICSGHNYKQN